MHLKARRHAKTASEQGGSLTPCPSLLPFSAAKSLRLGFLCVYFWQSPRREWWRRAVFPLVYLSVGLLLFKCENAGNDLASEMWVYKEIPWKSNAQALFVSLCPLSMPVANAIPCLHCQNILFQFSALRLSNSRHRQLDSVDVAKAALPAHYPIPCHAPSLPLPSWHKLIGLNPVINRLEKQLSMFAPPSFQNWGFLAMALPSLFQFFSSANTTAFCPVLHSFLFGLPSSGEANITRHTNRTNHMG